MDIKTYIERFKLNEEEARIFEELVTLDTAFHAHQTILELGDEAIGLEKSFFADEASEVDQRYQTLMASAGQKVIEALRAYFEDQLEELSHED